MSWSKLYNEDCLNVLSRIKSESVDLICTDPPYRVIGGGNVTNVTTGYNRSKAFRKNDGKIFKHNDIKIEDYIGEIYRVLKPGRDCYIMTNNINLKDLLIEAEKVGFKFHNLLVWKKNNANMNRWYMKNIELTCYFYKGKARTINNPGSKQVFEYDNVTNKKKKHPTEKPVALMRHYIENSTEPNWKVLDPFMGSGSTGVACKLSNRKFIGIEVDIEYFKIARERLV